MSGVAAHFFEVRVFSTGANTLLHRGSSIERGLLLAKEVRLEWHHARNREEQVGIVRDEAGRGNNRVASGLEERGEGTAQLVRSHRSHDALSLMTDNHTDRFSPDPLVSRTCSLPKALQRGRHTQLVR